MSFTPRERALHYAARSPAFAKLTPQHLNYFSSVLARPCAKTQRVGKILTEKDAIAPFNTDWIHQVEGVCPAVLLPTCATHVSEILKYCQHEKLAIVPQSGNTGLVYGSEPVHDELVLSTKLMNAEPCVSKETMTVESEAGVVLQHCQEVCEATGTLFPMSMGSKGSAMIGGNVSTNAGGIHYARYGSMHANVLGLEAVSADGTILNLSSVLSKDNAGYDLKHLFIGSEGTLGVITKAVIRVYPQPKSKQLAMFLVPDFESVGTLHQLAMDHLAECLSAFEVMDAESLLPTPDANVPFVKVNNAASFAAGSGGYASAYFCVLVETNGSSSEHDFEKLAGLVTDVSERLGSRITTDPILSQSKSQSERLWAMREEVSVYCTLAGVIYKYDISFPTDKFYAIVEHTREMLYRKYGFNPEEVLVVGYGHFGDGNLHLNVIDKTRTHGAALEEALYPAVYEFCAANQGSISAEHGVGLQKRDYLHLSRTSEAIQLMRSVKKMMDPNGILNPYKVLPLE